MNPENLCEEALSIFNNLPGDLQQQAVHLCQLHCEDEAVYLIALRNMNERERRKFLFRVSKKKHGL